MTGRWVTTGEAARLTGASVDTVRRACVAGRLKFHRPFGPKSDRRILIADLAAFIKAEGFTNALPLPGETSPPAAATS